MRYILLFAYADGTVEIDRMYTCYSSTNRRFRQVVMDCERFGVAVPPTTFKVLVATYRNGKIRTTDVATVRKLVKKAK